MMDFLKLFVHVLVSPFKTEARLEAEIVLLRHQLNVLRQRVPSKPKLSVADRLLFVWLYHLFPTVLNAIIVQPETIIRWHRTGFQLAARPILGGLHHEYCRM
jgi:putative transposase